MAALTPAFSTADANNTFLPDFIAGLVTQPVVNGSVAAQVSTVLHPGPGTHKLRIPLVTGDPSASWVSELEEIVHSEGTIDEAVSDFSKVAGLTRISREMRNDTNPAVLDLTGSGLVRDIARQIDTAFFTTVAAPAPHGLTTTAFTPVASGGYANLDPFAEAISKAEEVGASITSWVTNPSVALTLSKIKDQSGSNRTLLDRREVLGLPIVVSPYVATGTVWGIPADRVIVAVREDVNVTVDESRYFEYDAIALRAVMRIAFGFPHEAAIVRIASGS